MCSIAGSFNRQDTEAMLAMLRHRAPDEQGIWQDEKTKFCLGMGRLKIIDLESKNLCPHQSDNYILAFNGEIFNYLELRDEMKKAGRKFTTNSDTEVLLAAYRHWGLSFFDRLNGMFAFAIWDGNKNQIILARDIAGEKPFYYMERPFFSFASEAKALGFVCQELPRASYGIFDLRSNTFKIEKYWELSKREIKFETAVDELDELLADAVKIRTRSDVPYALYFSGGIDSSLLSTYHDYKYKLTYGDSLDYADEFKRVLPKIVWYLDYPLNSFSAFGLWKLAEEAKQKGIRVVISGEGADELFGGYIRYVPTSLFYEARQIFPSYQGMFVGEFEDVNEQGWNEFNGNMQELLRMGDRMASAHGVENRCPFLDKRIIEFAYSLPPELKIKGFETKVILRQLLKKRMPDYEDREKQGLYCSVNAWLGEENKFSKNVYLFHQQAIYRKFI